MVPHDEQAVGNRNRRLAEGMNPLLSRDLRRLVMHLRCLAVAGRYPPRIESGELPTTEADAVLAVSRCAAGF